MMMMPWSKRSDFYWWWLCLCLSSQLLCPPRLCRRPLVNRKTRPLSSLSSFIHYHQIPQEYCLPPKSPHSTLSKRGQRWNKLCWLQTLGRHPVPKLFWGRGASKNVVKRIEWSYFLTLHLCQFFELPNIDTKASDIEVVVRTYKDRHSRRVKTGSAWQAGWGQECQSTSSPDHKKNILLSWQVLSKLRKKLEKIIKTN